MFVEGEGSSSRCMVSSSLNETVACLPGESRKVCNWEAQRKVPHMVMSPSVHPPQNDKEHSKSPPPHTQPTQASLLPSLIVHLLIIRQSIQSSAISQ